VPNKDVIYLIGGGKNKKLTSYYQHNFNQQECQKFLNSHFSIFKWYGQRFIKKIYLNSLIKFIFYIFSFMPVVKEKINIIYKIADGPAVRELKNNNARYIIGVCRKKLK